MLIISLALEHHSQLAVYICSMSVTPFTPTLETLQRSFHMQK